MTTFVIGAGLFGIFCGLMAIAVALKDGLRDIAHNIYLGRHR